MIDRDMARKLKRIQIYSKHKVTAAFAGEYSSAFKGSGIEFEEVRPYIPGDEIRTIDWNVTARTGVPHIKRFKEERELTVYLLIDLSASCDFGTAFKSKKDTITEFAGLIAFTAIKNNDRVGLIGFTDKVEIFIPPAKGSKAMLRLLRDLISFEPSSKKTSLSSGLDYLGHIQKRKSVVFVVSDFIDSDYKKKLTAMGRRHDLIAVKVTDPREFQLNKAGLFLLRDNETGKTKPVDTSNRKVRKIWMDNYKIQMDTFTKICRGGNIDLIDVRTDRDWVHTVSLFFHRRKERMGR